MAKRLEDYSKDELIEMIEAYNLMTHIKNYNSMNKADLIKEIRNKFDVNENGQIVSKELTAYPTEFKKKVADIADKSEYSENDYNKIRIKISGQRGTIERIKDELGNYDNINKSYFDYDKMVKKKKALEERLQIEKNNLSKMIVLGKKIKEGYEKGVKTYEEEQKKPKLKKMKYTEFMKYYFLKHKGESPKDMMKNASQSWKDIKDKDHTNIINEYENLTKVKDAEKGTEKPKYGIKELKFNKDGLLDISDYRYVVGKRFELDKLMKELKEKIDDTPKTKKYETKLKKMNDDLQKLKDERKYYARIFNKHITRQSEIDNAPTEDEEEDKKKEEPKKPFLTEARKRRLKQQIEQQKKDEEASKVKPKKKEQPKEDDKFERMYKVLKQEDIELQLNKDKAKYVYDKYGIDMLVLVNNILYDLDKKNPSLTDLDKIMQNIKENIYSGPKNDSLPSIYLDIKEKEGMGIFDNLGSIISDEGRIQEDEYDLDDAKDFKVYYNGVKDYAEKLLKIYDKKEASKPKPFLTEARKRRLKQQLEQQKKDEEEMIKDIKKEVKKDDNIYEIDTSSTKFKKNETEYKDLKFKGILFKNAQIKKQVFKMYSVYHKHLIIANIFKDEKREDELVHKAFIETEYQESGKTAIKNLYIEMVKVFQEFRGQKLTETNFLLLWSYLNTYHKEDLNSLNYVLLQYAASVPVWTTYNRMINEIEFYNPLFDYILQMVIIDENIKLVLHHTFLKEVNFYWYKKNSNEYKNFITPKFITSFIKNIEDTGNNLNEKKKNPIVRENLQLKDNVDYKKVANEIIKQLKK